MILKHRHQFPDFRVQSSPFSAGAFMRLVQNSNSARLHLSAIFDQLTKVLIDTPFVTTNAVRFSLVNVFSPFTGFSHGLNEPPPKNVWPSSCHLVFTFALSGEHSFPAKAGWVSNRSLQVRVWGPDSSMPKFVTIGINSRDAPRLGLTTLHGFELEFLYNFFGATTKTWVLDPVSEPQEVDLYEVQDILDKPMINMLDEPFWKLKYNRGFSQYLSGVVGEVDASYVLYFFANFHRKQGRRNNQDTWYAISRSLSTVIEQSTLSFVQRVKSGDFNLTLKDLVAPVLIANLIASGDNDIEIGQNYLSDFRITARDLVDQFSDNEVDIAEILLPPQDTARHIINNDQVFASRLFSLLGEL